MNWHERWVGLAFMLLASCYVLAEAPRHYRAPRSADGHADIAGRNRLHNVPLIQALAGTFFDRGIDRCPTCENPPPVAAARRGVLRFHGDRLKSGCSEESAGAGRSLRYTALSPALSA